MLRAPGGKLLGYHLNDSSISSNSDEECSSESSDTSDSFFEEDSESLSPKPHSNEPVTIELSPFPGFFPNPNMIKQGDFHAWCVDEAGNVVDLPDEMLKYGKYQTDEIVRRGWDAHLVAYHLPELNHLSEKAFNKSKEELMELGLGLGLGFYMYERARLIRDSNPMKYALVVGSLGYRQSDGSIIWHFGKYY